MAREDSRVHSLLGVSPSKGKQGTARGKEKIF